MAGKCRDGIDLPDQGPCHACGAQEWENCRGQSYSEYMKMKGALEKNETTDRIKKEIDQFKDRRTATPEQGLDRKP